MSLIKSISGIRGTIGGKTGEGLSPVDIVKFTAAYAAFIDKTTPADKARRIVVGRDARLSGPIVSQLVTSTLASMGFEVINIGLATTPTTEIAVTGENACGGIIITASHNPSQWNALKLLDANGEFLNDAQGKEVLRIAADDDFEFATIDKIGSIQYNDTWLRRHIDAVLALPLVDREAIASANFRVAVDAVNSVGGLAIPALLRALGVKDIIELNCEPNGHTGTYTRKPDTDLRDDALRNRRCRFRRGSRCRPPRNRDGKRRNVCRRVHTGRNSRLCTSPYTRPYSEQPKLITRPTRRHRCPRLHLHCGCSRRGKRCH